MPYSYLSHLRCSKTGDIHDADQPQQLSQVGAPLLASYDLEALKKVWHPAALLGRPATLWRYHELLPVRDPAQVVTLGEGLTPLLPLRALGKQVGIPDLWMKDESIIPTGSFKARGAAVGISRARELGVTHFAMPTNGNAGAAWALYGARAGLRSTIVMPQEAPAITRLETSLAGARLYLVDGLISDAGRQVAQAVVDQSLFDASTLKEPYRIEGKKTMGLEIAEQLGWKLPDVIIYPTGGGVGLIGIYKALRELQELGWVKGDLPRLVAVQASGCAPIVQAWQQGASESSFWPDSQTLAFGINVPKALGDFLVLDALYRTNGCAIAVDDRAIKAEIRQLASLEGSFVCPEGAAAFAAARQLRESGWIKGGEQVVVLNTGAGIKYPDAITVLPQRLRRDGRIPA
ncbi:threonine synthase [Aeromonas salmonicida subsp. salmonicida]|uniref:Threonine synthase n=4 Tax=Aeromonas salmonicida TaxID=645 RepID=A0AAP3XKY4_AERSA|nr:threonine synthase [Aeromonas salmonicida]MBP6791573.1 threonine synthase [Aeromonas sp.]ASI22115.1 threonine synthase [Aeromonas salmonicida]ASI26430.1 threonine synthase [Aeromonas salmonicida]ASI30549.1 threonine synthase [Aeromonas salmonicida]ATD37795.1 threonine synthase [Aeromonas salmonicida subsp. masoucida]